MSELIMVASNRSLTFLPLCFRQRTRPRPVCPWTIERCTLIELTHRYQTPAPHTGDAPHCIKAPNVGSNSTAETSDDEQNGRKEKARSSTEHITKSSIQRLKGSARDQITRCEPGSAVCGIEI